MTERHMPSHPSVTQCDVSAPYRHIVTSRHTPLRGVTDVTCDAGVRYHRFRRRAYRPVARRTEPSQLREHDMSLKRWPDPPAQWRPIISMAPVLGSKVLAMVALGVTLAAADEVKPQFGAWGYDAAGADVSTKAGDDFFRYANGAWLDKTEIPAD